MRATGTVVASQSDSDDDRDDLTTATLADKWDAGLGWTPSLVLEEDLGLHVAVEEVALIV